MRLQRQLRSLLIISLATASAVCTQSCASSRRTPEDFGPTSPYPFSFTEYEVSDVESCADIVLTVDLQIPDVYSHAYEFPIRARLIVDTGNGTSMPGGSVGGISGDNPFDGSGFNGYVDIFELTAKSVTVSSNFSWTNWKHETGGFKKDFKLPYGKPLSDRLADGTTIEISWRKPKSAPKEAPPEESGSDDSEKAPGFSGFTENEILEVAKTLDGGEDFSDAGREIDGDALRKCPKQPLAALLGLYPGLRRDRPCRIVPHHVDAELKLLGRRPIDEESQCDRSPVDLLISSTVHGKGAAAEGEVRTTW